MPLVPPIRPASARFHLNSAALNPLPEVPVGIPFALLQEYGIIKADNITSGMHACCA